MARKRKYTGPSYDEVKAGIDAKEAAAAERKAARAAAKKPLTAAERHEQEKAARAKKGSSGYGYSQHLMGGSSSSSGFNPRSVREEVLVDYLLDEGFASDEKSAQAIAGAMSEEWRQNIVENRGMAYSGGKPGASGDGSRPKGITGGKTYQMPGWNDKEDKKQVKDA